MFLLTVLSELSSMTHLSWVALHGKAYSFIELCKPLYYDKAVICEWGLDFTPHQLNQNLWRRGPGIWTLASIALVVMHAQAEF